MIKGLLLGILLGILLVAGSVYLYFWSGNAPVATTAPPMLFERTLARLGLHSYLDKLPHPAPQVPADEANVIAGAKIYKEQCATCHGLPNEPKSAVAQGMFPAPPESGKLFPASGMNCQSYAPALRVSLRTPKAVASRTSLLGFTSPKGR